MSALSADKLIEIMRTALGEAGEHLTEGSLDTAFTELNVDSLAVLEIVTQVQDQFQLRIPDDVMESLKTPQDVLDYVNGRLAEAA